MSTQQQYAEPVPYYALNEDEVRELQAEAGDLRKQLEERNLTWVERARAEGRLEEIEMRLQLARQKTK